MLKQFLFGQPSHTVMEIAAHHDRRLAERRAKLDRTALIPGNLSYPPSTLMGQVDEIERVGGKLGLGDPNLLSPGKNGPRR